MLRTELHTRTASVRRDNVPSHCDTGTSCAITIQMPHPDSASCVERCATLLSFLLVVQEFERAVIFRLGRLRKGGARGPGLFFVLPCIDSYRKVDLRTVSFDVPPQELLSDREAISHMMQANLDEATDPWGVEVERVEIAKIITAEGEIKASKALKEASLVMIDNPMALQ
ncbi:Mechanosensory protein 2, partial [Operophtera brumata]